MIEEPASFQKTTDKKLTKLNIQPKKEYKCNKCEKPYYKQGALTTHIKNAHNISNPLPKRSSWQFYKNNESDNNNKNIEVYKLEVEHAKEGSQYFQYIIRKEFMTILHK